MAKKYYAVRKGKTCGIYTNWKDCEKQVKGISNAEFRAFNSIKQAENYLKGNEKKGFYAVRKGRKCGIFSTWEECKAQVSGYSNAEYQGFKTKAEAEKYLRDAGIKVEPKKTKEKAKKKSKGDAKNKTQRASGKITEDDIESLGIDESFLDLDSASAYVDGSFGYGKYSGAALILYHGEEIPLAKAYSDKQHKLRNVAGEIMGVVLAVKFCKKRNIKKLNIYHDYIGLSEWGNGNWKANLPLTQKYQGFIEGARAGGMQITFRKVKAHSGVEYNEIADSLAKDVLKNPSKYKSE